MVKDLDLLSDSDREALDFVAEKFGHLTTLQLVTQTHKYPEWEQYKSLFETRSQRDRGSSPRKFFPLWRVIAWPFPKSTWRCPGVSSPELFRNDIRPSYLLG